MGNKTLYLMVNSTVLSWIGHCRLIFRRPHSCSRNKCKRHSVSRIGELGEPTEEPKWHIQGQYGARRNKPSRAVYFLKFYCILSMEMAV